MDNNIGLQIDQNIDLFCQLHIALTFLHVKNDFQIVDLRRNDHPFSKLSCTLSACKRLPNIPGCLVAVASITRKCSSSDFQGFPRHCRP